MTIWYSCRTFLIWVIFCLTIVGASQSVRAEGRDVPLPVMLDHLLQKQEYDAARSLLRQSLGSSPDAVLHRGHFEGMILLRQRQPREAVSVFRSVLSLNPNFLPSRVELAKTLYLLGDNDAASHHFEAINLSTDDVGLRRLTQTFLNRIDRDAPYGFSGYVSIVPSTNINRGTLKTSFGDWVIHDDSRGKSGVGVAAGVNGFRNWVLDGQSRIILSGALDTKKYSNGNDYDELGGTANLSYFRTIDQFQLRFGPTVEYRLLAWQPYVFRYGVTFGASTNLGRRSLLSASVSVLGQDFLRDDRRDGWIAYGSATWRHMLTPSLAVSASFSAMTERGRIDRFSHHDYRLRFQADKEWSGGLLTSGFASIGTNNYLGPFISGTSLKRQDRVWSVGSKIAHRSFSFHGFVPELRYEFTRQHSNVSFYDYATHDVGLTLTRRF